MNSRTVTKGVLASVALMVLLSANSVLATSPQTLNIGVTGGVLDTGDQAYHVQGGLLAMALIQGSPMSPSSTIDYEMNAVVHDMKVTGDAHFRITGALADGTNAVVEASMKISDMVSQSVPVTCPILSPCTSALPVYFVGDSRVQVRTANSQPTTFQTTMMIESPYFNPFGAPIVMLSAPNGIPDNNVVIVATYTKGTIQWTGTSVGGAITGTVGSTPVTGTFTLTSHESEDLVAGTATDHGTMTFTGMSPSFLNVSGQYSGTSVIPTAGATDCSMQVTMIPGTCTQTGFQSTGQFSLNSGDQKGDAHGSVSVIGTYSTTWTVPALGFFSSATATVTQR